MELSRPITVLCMAIFLAGLTGCATSRQHQSASEYIDDTVITTKVKAALFDTHDLSSSGIHVETYHGEVLLSGFVPSASQIQRAIEVVKKVDGVKNVKSSLQVN